MNHLHGFVAKIILVILSQPATTHLTILVCIANTSKCIIIRCCACLDYAVKDNTIFSCVFNSIDCRSDGFCIHSINVNHITASRNQIFNIRKLLFSTIFCISKNDFHAHFFSCFHETVGISYGPGSVDNRIGNTDL